MNSENISSTELVAWLNAKIADAEKSVRAREDAEKTFRSGTDAQWKRAAAMHPSTHGKPMTKEVRLEAAAIQGRIAVKCRREAAMFKAVLAALS